MHTSVPISHPQTTTKLPAHEHAARRQRAKTERPTTSRNPRPKPTPAVPLGRKTVNTRF